MNMYTMSKYFVLPTVRMHVLSALYILTSDCVELGIEIDFCSATSDIDSRISSVRNENIIIVCDLNLSAMMVFYIDQG